MSVSADEVAKHNTDKDCWVIVGDQVLDVTNFLSDLAEQSGAEPLSEMYILTCIIQVRIVHSYVFKCLSAVLV